MSKRASKKGWRALYAFYLYCPTSAHIPTLPNTPALPHSHSVQYATANIFPQQKCLHHYPPHVPSPALPAFVPISPNSLSPSREKFIIHRGTISRTLHSLARIQFHPHYPVRIQSTHPKPSTRKAPDHYTQYAFHIQYAFPHSVQAPVHSICIPPFSSYSVRPVQPRKEKGLVHIQYARNRPHLTRGVTGRH